MTPDQEVAKRELLQRVGSSRVLLSQASGQVRELARGELKPFGIDINPEVADSIMEI
jgi:hypothetical protein